MALRLSTKLGHLVKPTAARAFSSCSETLSWENRDGVAVVKLDIPGEKVNTLNAALQKDFIAMLDAVEKDDAVKSVVLISGKPGCFIAGADIKQLDSCNTAEELCTLSEKGQAIMDRMENSSKPFVAAIDGSALGGGLEVALACQYRIATENKKTTMALPEVMLGLLPGAGGTQRLPRLVGLQKALPMMLQGKTIRPKQAKRMGLVNQLCDVHALEEAAVTAARQLASGELKVKPRKKSPLDRVLEDNAVGRSIVFKKATEMVTKATGGKYPAPLEILKAVEAGCSSGHSVGSKAEREGFGKLGMTPESSGLISLFFGQTNSKKNPFGAPAKKAETVTVIGGGLMGGGITQVSIDKAGLTVNLKDRDVLSLSKGEAYIAGNFDQKVKRKQMTKYERDSKMSKVVGLHDDLDSWTKHVGKSDLVIEAVFEDLGLKHKIISQYEDIIPEHCVIASNTSALPIADIAAVAKRPQNVLGMHYFSPVDKMQLLEIIPHAGTSDEACAVAYDVGMRQGKTCIMVKDVPGFYVNRCLGPFLSESTAVLGAGVEPARLDKVMTKMGMPVGPITLADEVGVEVAMHTADFLSKHLGERMTGGHPQIMQEMVDAGLLGRKTGKGFFMHPAGKQKGPKQINPEAQAIIDKYVAAGANGAALLDEEIQTRMLGRFINEAVLCLEDGIIRSAADGDLAAVFGFGFLPFVGGPFRYVDARGAGKFNDMMLGYADKYGPQFTPCQTIQDMAKSGNKFHN